MVAKRISLSLLAIGVISLVVSAASFALFSATTTNADNVFTAGTVTLGAPASSIANIDNIAPGDSGTYTVNVQYTGSLDAWLGVSATLTEPAGGGLLTCDGGGHFTATVNGGAADGSLNVVGGAPVSQNDTASVTVNWAFALAAGNDCQGDTATISVTFQAVQSRNNTNGAGTGPISWN